jgi:hypothetical protein
MPFCLHALVESATVSADTEPVDVMVVNDMPVPAATDVTVPVPLVAIIAARESSPFCLQALVENSTESTASVGTEVLRITPVASVHSILEGDADESIVRIRTLPFTSNASVGEGVDMPTSLVVA